MVNSRMGRNSQWLFVFVVSVFFLSKYPLKSDDNSDIDKSRSNAITRAVKKCSPAIVGINVTEKVRVRSSFGGGLDDWFSQFFGDSPYFSDAERYREVQELGSGFIISDDGYVITNHHVAGNASKIVITMTGGKKYDAKVIGADETSDVALLKIDSDDKFPYIKLANSDKTIVGEWSIAFGNPFGLFDLNAKPTVTVGVVSNLGVSFVQEKRVYKEMIQTDAAISSGNSGGPLINADGEVIGVNTVIFTTAQNRSGAGSIGIGWALPINRVKVIIDKFKNGDKINRNFFVGMDLQLMDKNTAKRFKSKVDEGLLVTRVYNSPSSSAYGAGIEPGDIITEIDRVKIREAKDYYLTINDGVVGQKFNIVLFRGDDKIETTMTLKENK
jgi:serine protease Do